MLAHDKVGMMMERETSQSHQLLVSLRRNLAPLLSEMDSTLYDTCRRSYLHV